MASATAQGDAPIGSSNCKVDLDLQSLYTIQAGGFLLYWDA